MTIVASAISNDKITKFNFDGNHLSPEKVTVVTEFFKKYGKNHILIIANQTQANDLQNDIQPNLLNNDKDNNQENKPEPGQNKPLIPSSDVSIVGDNNAAKVTSDINLNDDDNISSKVTFLSDDDLDNNGTTDEGKILTDEQICKLALDNLYPKIMRDLTDKYVTLIKGPKKSGKTLFTHFLDRDAKADVQVGKYGKFDIIPTNCNLDKKMPNIVNAGNKIYCDIPGGTKKPWFEMLNDYITQNLTTAVLGIQIVFVVPDHAIFNAHNFVDMIHNNLLKDYGHLNEIENYISLVVTKADAKRIPKHVKSLITDEIINKPNEFDNKIINICKAIISNDDNIIIFHAPQKGGEYKSPNFGDLLCNNTQYLLTDNNYEKLNPLSSKAQECSHQLLSTECDSYYKLIELFGNNIIYMMQLIINNKHPLLIGLKCPQSHNKSIFTNKEITKYEGYFSMLDQLQSLNKVLNQQMDGSFTHYNKCIIQTFDTLLKYCNPNVENYIMDLKHKFQQLHSNISYLSNVGNKDLPKTDMLKIIIDHWKTINNLLLISEIKSFKPDLHSKDPEYYQQSLELLNICKDDYNCKKTISDLNIKLGDLLIKQQDDHQALEYYYQAKDCINDNPTVYFKIGFLLFCNGDYLNAIECFRKIDNILLIEKCFAECKNHNSSNEDPITWLKKELGNEEVYFKQAEFEARHTYYKKALNDVSKCRSIIQIKHMLKIYDDNEKVEKLKPVLALEKQLIDKPSTIGDYYKEIIASDYFNTKHTIKKIELSKKNSFSNDCDDDEEKIDILDQIVNVNNTNDKMSIIGDNTKYKDNDDIIVDLD